MVGTPKATAVLLSLALAASLAACSPDSDRHGPGADSRESSQGSDVSDGFPQRNVMVTAVCSPGNGSGGVVDVDGWNPQSWKHVAHVEFRLPDAAVVESDKARPNTAVRDLCEADKQPADAGDVTAIRSLFDQEFTKMAVVTEDPQTEASHVGYVDRSGRFTDLTGNKDFGDTPHEDNAAFSRDGSEVWFTYDAVGQNGNSATGRVASRALAGDHKTADHLRVETVGERHLVMVGSPSRAVLASDAHLSPDGKRLLSESHVLELSADRRAVGPDLVEKGRFVSCDGGGQVGWLGNAAVLCDAENTYEGRFARLDISPEAKPGAPIVPSNDHHNYGMVVSPDGRRFAFLSVNGTVRDYYLCDTTSGSTPKKVQRTGEFSTLGDAAVFIDWR
ncbi:hypothetical protein ABZ079_28075 [Streptomyces sp. NPDC006314]|uniref:hypothetical protein n=1 Tax=Streptomyces sp. NPDC006314 TaxID=3154475 RepID=UPI0033BEF64B